MRHADAAAGAGVPDHERPLSPQGRDDAGRMGTWMQDHGLLPERVVCSTALRARQTLSCAAATWPDVETVFERRLYAAGAAEAHALLGDGVLLVGHNPTMDLLVKRLEPAAPDMRPGSVACFEGERLVVLRRPSDLPDPAGID